MKVKRMTASRVTVELTFEEVEFIALELPNHGHETTVEWLEDVWWPTIEIGAVTP